MEVTARNMSSRQCSLRWPMQRCLRAMVRTELAGTNGGCTATVATTGNCPNGLGPLIGQRGAQLQHQGRLCHISVV